MFRLIKMIKDKGRWRIFKLKLIDARLYFVSIFVGLLTGLVAVPYHYLLQFFFNLRHDFFDSRPKWYWYIPLFLLMWGILVFVSWLVKKMPLITGGGIPQTRGVINGRVAYKHPFIEVIAKFVGGILALSTGLSLGREGPSVQIGAMTGQGIGNALNNTNLEVLDENSNKNGHVVSTQRDLIAGEVSKDIARRKLIPADIVQAHDSGAIHFHDMDYIIQPMFNCCLINLEDMLANGTVINGKKIDTPKSFQVACTVTTQIIAQVASSQYGGQSISLTHLAPFVEVSRQKIRRQVDADSHAIYIEARSLGRELVDCQYSKTLSGLKLGEIVKRICSTFKVPVKIEAETAVVPDFSMQCELPANALINAVRAANLLLYPLPDGGLVLTKPTDAAPVASLVYGVHIKRYEVIDEFKLRFSDYVIKGYDYASDAALKGAAKDGGITFFRPMHIVADRHGHGLGGCDRRIHFGLARLCDLADHGVVDRIAVLEPAVGGDVLAVDEVEKLFHVAALICWNG